MWVGYSHCIINKRFLQNLYPSERFCFLAGLSTSNPKLRVQVPVCPSPASQSLPVSGLVIVCNLIVRHSYTSYTDISITGQRSEIRMVSGLVLSTVVGSTQTNMGVICTFSLTFFLIVSHVSITNDHQHLGWTKTRITDTIKY